MAPKPQSFENSLAELEKIVARLEQGDLALDESLTLFERGVKLSRECQERLSQAERRIEVLLKGRNGEAVLEDLEDAAEIQHVETVEIQQYKTITFETDEEEDDDTPF